MAPSVKICDFASSLGEGALIASLLEGGGFYAVKLGGSKVGATIGRPDKLTEQ